MGKLDMRWVNPLKGFTMVLVVWFHATSGCFNAGLFNNMATYVEPINDYFAFFRMPIFFVISGFLFYKFYNTLLVKDFKNKLLGIGIFYVFYSILMICTQMILSGNVNSKHTVSDILLLPVYTVAPYWYLYLLTLFYIFSYFIIKKIGEKILILSFILSILSQILPHIKIFDLSRCLYYFFFWIIGGYLCTYAVDLHRFKKCIFLLFFLELALIFTSMESVIPKALNAFILVMILVLSFANFRFLNSSYIWNICGKYCLSIYLFHVYLTAGTRVVLKCLGFNNFYLYVITGTILGIVVPIMIYEICIKNKILKIFFQPVKTLQNFGVIKE